MKQIFKKLDIISLFIINKMTSSKVKKYKRSNCISNSQQIQNLLKRNMILKIHRIKFRSSRSSKNKYSKEKLLIIK